MDKLESGMQTLNTKLMVLEDDSEDLEVLAGLTNTSADSQNLYLVDNDVIASLPIYKSGPTAGVANHLDDLESRIHQAMSIQTLIEDKYIQTQMAIKHIPSIRPIAGGRITDKFGNRKDPFIERVKHHRGIDLSASFGTQVFAAAAGVVEFTRVKYRLNAGYGRVVIINHGNGYKTLYGHLAAVNVARGQKVDRWDAIGLSGDTGRATGPHLHYEVWRNGYPENPENYILN
ncbi:MAG TPA: M23 family metallopeptidase [bacterium]